MGRSRPAPGDGGGRGNGADQGGAGDGPESLVPNVDLPRGGGAIRGIGEKFQANAFTGTGGMTIPIALSPARAGTPELSVGYDSGNGNGPFGLGWRLSVPAIARKTDKGLPQYRDEQESDVFVLSEAEDLVPLADADGTRLPPRDTGTHAVFSYRPRVEAGFARIERWVDKATKDTHWRVTSRDNVISIFGRDPAARVADPADPRKVFRWLLEQVRDDRGNVTLYEYKAEDTTGVDVNALEEHERFHEGTAQAQRYLKRIRYGNRDAGTLDAPPSDYAFEVVLDYGEHVEAAGAEQFDVSPTEVRDWPTRSDTFSSYRSTFDIRTRRLCRQILVFHHFTDAEFDSDGGPLPRLVRSTDFTHAEDPTVSLLTGVTQRGYRWSGTGTIYDADPFPPVDLDYVPRTVDQRVQQIDAAELADMPAGIDGSRIRLVDLEGEGIPGLLQQQRGALFYKRAAGEGTYEPTRALSTQPSVARPQAPSQRLLDLDGDGRLSLVELGRSSPGFHDRDMVSESWKSFRPFRERPTIEVDQPNVRFVDLDGDGLPDLLLHEPHRFTWWRSKGREGWGDPAVVPKPGRDEEAGPQIVFQDPQRLIAFADMTGDGLSDIVRIRNGEIVYWPNLGYGRFGRKITMAGAPRLDAPSQFSAERLRLADVDGTGTSDVLYLDAEGARLWFNQAGNGFSEGTRLEGFPALHSVAFAEAADLLGKGTAALVWSSPLPGAAARRVSFIDLMAEGKPYLLRRTTNNLGLETRVSYASSTKFYLQDRKNLQPWVTKLPFPVQVVEQVEVLDHIAQRRFVNTFAYHHGYFDGPEREFRGFGLVEQRDTESFEAFRDAAELAFADQDAAEPGVQLSTGHQLVDESLHVPPVLTKTWFHTGAYLGLQTISRQFASEYFDGDPEAVELPDTVLPPGLTGLEQREAVRALRGRTLHQEVYAEDGTADADKPYTVSEANFTVRTLQAKGGQRHASFFVHERETLSYQYERSLDDPRLSQSATLQVDDFGNVLQSIEVAYPRRGTPEEPEQGRTDLVVSEADFVNQSDAPDVHRIGTPIEQRSFELRGNGTAGDPLAPFGFEDLQILIAGATEVPFEADPDPGVRQKRLLSKTRDLYYAGDFLSPLPFGEVGALALPFETRQMALTEAHLSEVFGARIADPTALLAGEGGYVNEDGAWWTRSSRQVFDPTRFFMPIEVHDPLGNPPVTIDYDGNHLLLTQVTDPVGNVTVAEPDYRVLQPRQVTDPNGNRQFAAFDGRGLVVATAIAGKAGEPDPTKQGDDLGDPTTTLEYDLFQFVDEGKPVFVHSRAKKRHGEAEVQQTRTYSDGSGNVIMEKVQAERGEAVAHDPSTGALLTDEDGEPIVQFADPRWVGTGRTITDNKGNPIKQYEPFFTDQVDFEPEDEVGLFGVSPLLHYDPLGRNIRTDFPDGTVSRVEFDAWSTTTFDRNDTLTTDSRWFTERQAQGGPAARAADEALVHADTPTLTVVDTLGRVFLTREHLRNATDPDAFPETRQVLDVQGNVLKVLDAQDKRAQASTYGMLGQVLRTTSPDAGQRHRLEAADGNPLRAWDARGFVRRFEYDEARRPTHTHVEFPASEGGGERLVERIFYGERVPDATTLNLRGQAFRMYDGAGLASHDAFDFKGNLVSASRRVNQEFRDTPDWSPVSGTPLDGSDNLDLAQLEADTAGVLEAEVFTTTSTYDALNRLVTSTTPDGSIRRLTYNDASLLERLDVDIHGEGTLTPFVQSVEYNARGQRLSIAYGNGTQTTYTYDPETFRLLRLVTTRPHPDPDQRTLQDLTHHYDPFGNVAEIQDGAQQAIYFANSVTPPGQRFVYDSLYRLVEATGREHIHDVSGGQSPQRDDQQLPVLQTIPSSTDPDAVRAYIQRYAYDLIGNLLQMDHEAPGSGTLPSGSWTRHYAYEQSGGIPQGNRLLATTRPEDDPSAAPATWSSRYAHDAHGNMTSMPHLGDGPDPGTQTIFYDHADRTQRIDLGGGGTLYAQYDTSGDRIRKVRVNDSESQVYEERIYLGDYEIFRKRPFDPASPGTGGAAPTDERQTLHVTDDTERLAMVETQTRQDGSDIATPTPKQRYQLSNHLGSAAVELDGDAAMISYEEYHPFGTTSFHSLDSTAEVSAKRYRYVGKERDEGSGLYYIGARYYAPWLGRWTRPDPAGLVDGPGRYSYARNNPVRLNDPGGRLAGDPHKEAGEARIQEIQRQGTTKAAFGIPEAEESQPKGEGAPDTSSAGIGEGTGRPTGRKKQPPPPPAGTGGGAGGPGVEPGGSGGTGATELEKAAALATVLSGEEVNFEAQKTKLGLEGGLAPPGAKVSAGLILATLGVKEAALSLAFGVAGRLLGGLGKLLRKLGAEKLSGKLDKLAEAVRNARNQIGESAAKKALPGQFGPEDVAFGLAAPRGKAGGLVEFGGQATLGTRAPLSETTSALEGVEKNLAIAQDTLRFARETLEESGGRLRFNLTGVDEAQALTPGSPNFNTVTSAELRGVLEDPFLRGRVDFFRNGANITDQVFNAARRKR